MILRTLGPRLRFLRRAGTSVSRRTLIAAPKPGSGPLLERRSDRALPNQSINRSILYSIPLFIIIVAGSTLAIFNYQKSSSSVVASTLYALRTHRQARELLGSEITFRAKVPWIKGELNQLHGNIDISYGVKGTKGEGVMRFRSVRRSRMGLFETEQWDLVMKDGTRIELLENAAADPFPQSAGTATASV